MSTATGPAGIGPAIGYGEPVGRPLPRRSRRRRVALWWLIVAAALLSTVVGYRGLAGQEAVPGEHYVVDAAQPVLTVWRPDGPPEPAVVIVHGLTGSQQVMRPYALALFRAGYVVVTVDLPGHGRNPQPLPQVGAGETRLRALGSAIDRAVGYARLIGDGRVGLVGHSMGADAVIRYGHDHPQIGAVVALSPGDDERVDGTGARDLLVITGAREPGLRPVAQRIADRAAGQVAGAGRFETQYGDLAAGSARRVDLAAGADHLGVLFAPSALGAARQWMLAALPPRDRGGALLPRADPAASTPDGVGLAGLAWLGVVYLGVALWLLAVVRILPFGSPVDAGRLVDGEPGDAAWTGAVPPGRDTAGGRWATWFGRPGWWLVAVTSAVLAAVATALVPDGFFPVWVGGRVVTLLAVDGAGLLVGAGLLARRSAVRGATRPDPYRVRSGLGPIGLVGTVLGVPAVACWLIGYPTDRFLLSVYPVPHRWPVLLVFVALAVPWALGDALLVRRPDAPRGAGGVTLAGVLAAMLLAIRLDPVGLGFLLVVGPLLAAALVGFAVLAELVRRRTGSVAGVVALRAVGIAWVIGTVFPMVR